MKILLFNFEGEWKYYYWHKQRVGSTLKIIEILLTLRAPNRPHVCMYVIINNIIKPN